MLVFPELDGPFSSTTLPSDVVMTS